MKIERETGVWTRLGDIPYGECFLGRSGKLYLKVRRTGGVGPGAAVSAVALPEGALWEFREDVPGTPVNTKLVVLSQRA